MCNCVGVDFGTYDAAVTVDIPPHMHTYRDNRMKAGLSGNICVDICILPEIRDLWSKGIVTYGSCCGHNKQAGCIDVADESIEKMEALGYEHGPNPNGNFSFISKTCPGG